MTDWATIHMRLARALAMLEQVEISAEQRDAIFAQRAAELAQVPAATAGDEREALLFTLAGERYAVPCAQAREIQVRGQQELVPLPTAPPFIAGLLNVRGQIVTVLDLARLFGLRQSARGDPQSIILLAGPKGDVGVLSEDRPEIVSLHVTPGMELPPDAPSGLEPAFVRGVTRDLILLLDVERLLEDARLLVQEDV